MDSEACGSRPSLSEPLPLAPDAVSLAVAEFTRGSSARLDAKATGTLNTSELPAPAAIIAPLALKLPLAVVTEPQVETPLALQTTLPFTATPAGSVSSTETSSASLDPVVATVMV